VAEPPVWFADVLRKLRAEAGLTQEELAAAAGLSSRAISYLERGVVTAPRKDTVRLLADALQLAGSARGEFEATARLRAVSGESAVPRTLPRDNASFTGRRQELADLAKAAEGVVGIHAIGGMAGVGKTTFAVHAAYQLADRFPGGQFFLPLHGHTPGQRPTDPGDALVSLLLMLGVRTAQIPPGLEARTGLWRDRVAGKRLLLVLDDAIGSEQVLPLLPGTGGSLVLVTSRRRLSALEGARAISLDVLPTEEAIGLLIRLAARPGLDPADPAVAEIARLCGYLPLAIGMLARQLHHHPAWTAAGRAVEMADASDRLDLLATEHLSVTAAFDLSYADLEMDQRRLFRRLALHPGTEVDAYAAAALDGASLGHTQRQLEALYDQCLLTEPAAGRYRMHDLIREHARVLASQLDPDFDRDAATTRLLDYYQVAAARAGALLSRQARTVPAPAAGTRSATVPAMGDLEQALAWARVERSNLLACLDQVTAAGQDDRIIALTAGLAGLLRHDGSWAEAITRHATALRAARRLGDRLGQANALITLGDLRWLVADYPGAVRDLQEAMDISRGLRDRSGEARALANLGVVRRDIGDYQGAARDLRDALDIQRDIGDRSAQAYTLFNLGRVWQLTGDCPGAAPALRESLDIYRDLGDRLGQANALITLGQVRQLTADYPAAARDLELALAIHRDLGYRLGQANALTYLGIVRRETGEHQAAAQNLGEALDVYRDTGDPRGEVRVLNESGILAKACGDLGQARSYHQQALNVARQIGSAFEEAHALAGLGRCALAGHTTGAREALRQALDIFQRIGAGEAGEVSAELNALSG
jgi:tetratricopeptide (TPR) repeat protein/transcriptional regulator with XRE-family HTH domain